MRCPFGAACSMGMCACPAGSILSMGRCVDVSSDPLNCGTLGNDCGDTQYCVSGVCACRPGLVLSGTTCVDPASNPAACGPMGTVCAGATPRCQAGVCVAMCTGGLTACGNSCINRRTDPLNCGGCVDTGGGEVCNTDQVCSNGNCEDFRPATGCTMCPCTTCGGRSCCSYPMTTSTICVDGACP